MLSAELFTRHGIKACDKTVAKLLRDHGYSLRAPNKSVEGKQHPDRTNYKLTARDGSTMSSYAAALLDGLRTQLPADAKLAE